MTSKGTILNANLITDLLELQARYKPDEVAIVHRGSECVYASLDAQANRIGQWLCQAGIKTGDRIVLYGVNSDRLVAALFGTLKAGGIFVPVHPETPYRKLEFILQDCTPSAIVADPELVDAHESLWSGFNRPILLTSSVEPANEVKEATIVSWDMLSSYPSHSPGVYVPPDALAAIIYTSGSTKDPKGVMEPHRQVIFATSAINTVLGNCAEDVILLGLPISFDYGLYQIFLTFQAGARLILERNFAFPMAIPRLLNMHKVTGFPGVPSLFAMLLRSRLLERVSLPDLRYISSTGDVFPPSHIRRLRELFPHTTIFPMYGLTECKRVSIVPQGKLDGHESSVGLSLPGTQVSVVDEDGRASPPGVVGELVVWGPHVMAGYWNDPEGTARRFRRDDSTGEILLYTGDFFRMDRDGFLYFMGRDEIFIKSHGQKVSPAEIETFLCEIEGVAEAAAVGVPDATLGESVCVFVSLVKPGCVTAEDIAEQCKHALSPVGRPERIVLLDSPLPKTSNGKIDRAQLRLMAAGDTGAERIDNVDV